jgi:hypothetical protein
MNTIRAKTGEVFDAYDNLVLDPLYFKWDERKALLVDGLGIGR